MRADYTNKMLSQVLAPSHSAANYTEPFSSLQRSDNGRGLCNVRVRLLRATKTCLQIFTSCFSFGCPRCVPVVAWLVRRRLASTCFTDCFGTCCVLKCPQAKKCSKEKHRQTNLQPVCPMSSAAHLAQSVLPSFSRTPDGVARA